MSTKPLIERAIDVGTGRLEHLFRGYCPDLDGFDDRDHDCPACQVLVDLEEWGRTAATIAKEGKEPLETAKQPYHPSDFKPVCVGCHKKEEESGIPEGWLWLGDHKIFEKGGTSRSISFNECICDRCLNLDPKELRAKAGGLKMAAEFADKAAYRDNDLERSKELNRLADLIEKHVQKHLKPQKVQKTALLLSDGQLLALKFSCELVSRLYMGQIGELSRLNTVSLADRDLNKLKTAIYKDLEVYSYHGIKSQKIDDEARVLYDLYQVIRHFLAWRDAPNTPETRDWSSQLFVQYDIPMRTSETESLAEIKEA